MIIGIILFAFMRALGELLLSNSKFNSFVDIANEYLGPFGGFVIGWTYWICWVVSSMSDLTAMGNISHFGILRSSLVNCVIYCTDFNFI